MRWMCRFLNFVGLKLSVSCVVFLNSYVLNYPLHVVFLKFLCEMKCFIFSFVYFNFSFVYFKIKFDN